MLDLEELERLLAKATKGPLKWLPDEGNFIVDASDNVVGDIPCRKGNPMDGELFVAAVNALPELIAKYKKAMRALEHLTVGGSEFVGDVDACVDYIRKKQESLHEGFKAAIKEKIALIARIRELEAKADVVRNEESSLWWTAMCSLNCMTLAEWGQKRRDETVAAVKKAPDGGAIELEAKLARRAEVRTKVSAMPSRSLFVDGESVAYVRLNAVLTLLDEV